MHILPRTSLGRTIRIPTRQVRAGRDPDEGTAMRYATVRLPDGTTRGARLEGEELVLTDAPDAIGAARGAVEDERRVPYDEAELDGPTLRPRKVICVGLNYESHILEMGRQLPTHPTLFAKFDRTLTGPRDPIVLPAVSEQVDWEVELGVVIGREARDVTAEQARDVVAGFTVVNDVSMRDWQRRTGQFLAGKAFERTTPVGPVLVTPDEVDHAADLEIRCEVDGVEMQRSRTSDLVFDPHEVISYISRIVTLDPGDLIATGTPGGVGAGRDPQVFLQPGQTLVTAIEGIGELVNPCVAPA